MPSLTLDGKKVDFQPGETIIQAATRENVEIPYYCWHPRLSVAANCRMCLVEVEKAPKLMPACQTAATDGMVVHTQNEKVKDAQRAVHEFLLVNHPIDCPICDQAGECKLQDYYMEYQLAPSRVVEHKVNKPRLEELGPHVVYNAERCIVCTRCVRFMDEVAQNPQLGVFNRGDHSEIGCAPGVVLDDAYSLNTVDVCPVGALTSTIFRFKQRAWNLKRSDSVCGGCARGCNIHVDQRSGVVYRLLPRDNDAVNKSWLCDEGRLTYNRPNEGKITEALIREGQDAPTTTDGVAALNKAVELLKPLANAGKGVAATLSLHATVEEAYVFGRFVKDVLKADTIGLVGLLPGGQDDLLRVADKNPNRAGVMAVFADMGLKPVDERELMQRMKSGTVKAWLAVGHETSFGPELALAAKGLEVVVHVAYARGPIAEVARVTLPGVSWVQTDGTWVNVQQRAQRLKAGFLPEHDAKPTHAWLMDIASRLGVAYAWPSMTTIRAEIESQLPSFREAKLTQVPPTGTQLPWAVPAEAASKI